MKLLLSISSIILAAGEVTLGKDLSTRKPDFCIFHDNACYINGIPECCQHYEYCPTLKPACTIITIPVVGNTAKDKEVATTSVAGGVDVVVDHRNVHVQQPEEVQLEVEESGDYSCGRGTPPPYSCQCCFYAPSLDDWCCYYSDFGNSWMPESFNPPGCDGVDKEEWVAAEGESDEGSFLRGGR